MVGESHVFALNDSIFIAEILLLSSSTIPRGDFITSPPNGGEHKTHASGDSMQLMLPCCKGIGVGASAAGLRRKPR